MGAATPLELKQVSGLTPIFRLQVVGGLFGSSCRSFCSVARRSDPFLLTVRNLKQDQEGARWQPPSS